MTRVCYRMYGAKPVKRIRTVDSREVHSREEPVKRSRLHVWIKRAGNCLIVTLKRKR